MLRFFPKAAAHLARMMLVLVALFAPGCAESLSLETPGDDVLFYQPRSMANMNDTTVLLVNTNYDKRFAAGWISAIDVSKTVAAITNGTDGAAAVSRPLMVPRLGGRLVVDPNKQKIFLPHTGSGILTVIDVKADGSLSCGDTGDRSNLPTDLSQTSCDRYHLVDLIDQAWQQDTSRKQSDFRDPAAVAYVAPPGAGASLLVGYLGVPWVTTLAVTDVPNLTEAQVPAATLSAPTYQSPFNSIRHFTVPDVTDPATIYGAGSANQGSAIIPIGVNGSILYSGTYLDLATPTGGQVIERTLVSPVDSSTIYALNRVPDQIVTIKSVVRPVGLAPFAGGGPAPAGSLQLQPEIVSLDGAQPFDLAYAARSAQNGGLTDIIAVVGVAKNTVYFLQPGPGKLHLVGRLPLESNTILTSPTPALAGGGPGGVAYVNARAFGTKYTDLLFVANYYSHTVSVIDISSQSPAAFAEVLRIEGNDLGPSLRYP